MTPSRTLALLIAVILPAGCTKTISHPVAAYYPGNMAPTTQPVPRTAVYSIRFLDEKGRKFGGVPGSQRLLQAGDHVGFEMDDEGAIVAIAANEKLALDVPPRSGMVWSTTYHKPTQFSKEVAKAATGTAKAAGAATGIFIKSTVENMLHDDDEDEVTVRAGLSVHRRHR